MAAKLKKGDRVVVIAGVYRGVEGEILKVFPARRRAVVSGVRKAIRHQKQTQHAQGGRLEREAPIDLSNLAMIDPETGGATRVGFRMEEGKKIRFARKSGARIDGA